MEKATVLAHGELCCNAFFMLMAPSDCLQSHKGCWLLAGRETSQDSSEKGVFGAPVKGYLIRHRARLPVTCEGLSHAAGHSGPAFSW